MSNAEMKSGGAAAAVPERPPRIHSAYRESTFSDAIAHWWTEQSRGIRAGKSMDGFRERIVEELVKLGVDENDIYPRPKRTGIKQPAAASHLPSYFRASKNWDLLICKNSLYRSIDAGTPGQPGPVLIAAIEFKSQLKSIGKNQNNRVEEGVGSALDFWESYRSLNFGSLTPRPWLGYLFVGRYEEADADKDVQVSQPHFPSDKAFVWDHGL